MYIIITAVTVNVQHHAKRVVVYTIKCDTTAWTKMCYNACRTCTGIRCRLVVWRARLSTESRQGSRWMDASFHIFVDYVSEKSFRTATVQIKNSTSSGATVLVGMKRKRKGRSESWLFDIASRIYISGYSASSSANFDCQLFKPSCVSKGYSSPNRGGWSISHSSSPSYGSISKQNSRNWNTMVGLTMS